ncbi:hypothetical protein GGR56DRAFT_298792 [Xylariaceae sp. FL0804]|nr:hypothetical protein GGR56DRAFT_298792 [Xylariaceae sp. FL0804]
MTTTHLLAYLGVGARRVPGILSPLDFDVYLCLQHLRQYDDLYERHFQAFLPLVALLSGPEGRRYPPWFKNAFWHTLPCYCIPSRPPLPVPPLPPPAPPQPPQRRATIYGAGPARRVPLTPPARRSSRISRSRAPAPQPRPRPRPRPPRRPEQQQRGRRPREPRCSGPPRGAAEQTPDGGPSRWASWRSGCWGRRSSEGCLGLALGLGWGEG